MPPRPAPAPPTRPPCAGLWDTPMVQVNGDVTVCCLDEHLENVIGNVTETPLAALWSGPTIERWREAHAEGRFADSGPYCTRCNWRSAGTMSPERIAAWRASRGVAAPAGGAGIAAGGAGARAGRPAGRTR